MAELMFPAVEERDYPWGIKCSECGRVVKPGQPFQPIEEETSGGSILIMLLCVYCNGEGV